MGEAVFNPLIGRRVLVLGCAVILIRINYPGEKINGDITKIDEKSLPDFDFLLAGFPCQTFSPAGRRLGFLDTRGTLFFDVERIIKEKRPYGFILENVEGLLNHNKENKNDAIGQTFSTILKSLNDLGYMVSWRVHDAISFGIPQERRRIYIAGTKKEAPLLDFSDKRSATLSSVLENGLECEESILLICC